MSGSSARIRRAARRPSSVWVGGIRMSTTATSGRSASDRRAAARRSRRRGRRRRSRTASSTRAMPSRSSSESSPITTRMGSPLARSSRRRAGSSISSVPSSAASRSAIPRRPEPRRGVGAAAAVVGDRRRSACRRSRSTRDVGARGVRVADDVGQRLGGEEVGGGLDGRRAALLGRRTRSPTGSGARRDERAQRRRRARARSAPPGGCRGRARAARRWRAGAPRARGRAARRPAVASSPSWMHLQVEADGEQAVLGAVVEVALEPAARLVGGGDDPGARVAQLALALRGGR